jgi:PAS domain S-box-containing protein
MKKKVNKSDASTLRQKAEELLHKKNSELGSKYSDVDALKLIHELEVHKLELEMQNEELMRAKEQAELSNAKYIELYDFAPTGYFLISRAGKILEVNLTGASMFGKERKFLKNSISGFTVAIESKPTFNLFLDKVFTSAVKESCEIKLLTNNNAQIDVLLTGIVAENGENCYITAVDITEKKQADKLLNDLIDKNPMSIQIMDRQGFTLKVNTAHSLLFGPPPPSNFSIFDDLQSKGFGEYILRAKKGEVVHFPDIYYNVHDVFPELANKPVWIRAVLFPLTDANSIFERFVFMHEDITERKMAEEALHESEEQFRILTSLAPAGIYLTDTKGNCEYTNQQWNLMAGLSSEESRGIGWIKGIHPDDRELVFSSWKKMVESEGQWGLEYRFQTPNGKNTWVYGLATPQRDHSGNIIRYVGLNLDITERKHAELALQKSEDLLNTTGEMAQVGGWEIDLYGNTSAWTEETFRIHELSPEIQPDVTEAINFYHPEDREKVASAVEQAITTGRPFDFEARLITSLGNLIWVRSSGKTISENGKNVGIRGSIQNITNRKLFEESLRHSKLQYDNLVSKIPVGVYILRSKPDGAFALDFVSPRMAEMLNLSISGLLANAQLIFEVIHPEERVEVIKLNQDGILSCQPFNWKGRIVFEETVKWMHIMSSPDQLENGDILWHGIIIDITERVLADAEIKKVNEELIKLNTDKDRLISILGHDLKSPFNAILGFLELLTENVRKYDIDKIEKQLKIINTSAQNVHNLLDNILIWTRSHSGKIPFEPTQLSLIKLCNEVIELVEQNARVKNITISHLVTGDIRLYADIEMVKTIVRNLISNAIKFSHSGGTINIFAEQFDSETRITVLDNGVGISSEVQKTLFSSFEMHSTKGTANESGTGLGLTICKDFVEKHGGRIWVESEEGNGSSFTFSIPNHS